VSIHSGPEESPGYLLWKVSALWRRAIEAVLRPLGLTHPQFVILAAIGWLTRQPKEVRQIEIARFAGLDPNTTSQILRSLQTKKLIRREISDGRSKSPSLTAVGSALLQKALPAVEKADSAFFQRVDGKKTVFILALQILQSMK
ncbi:MAG TPA: MarR family transcriptional regulator, partial [Chlamydiales bacterium]|nr:MarR family transcriptional regulator [Chlamydiales bacterium]